MVKDTPKIQLRLHSHTLNRHTDADKVTDLCSDTSACTQGDFGCRETDGRAAALVQPALRVSDSRCGLQSASADQEVLYANLTSSHKPQPGTQALNPAKEAVKTVHC